MVEYWFIMKRKGWGTLFISDTLVILLKQPLELLADEFLFGQVLRLSVLLHLEMNPIMGSKIIV